MNATANNIEPPFDLSLPDLQNLPDSFPSGEQTEISNSEKFVVFFLDDELFAVSAERVREVVRPLAFTPLPNSPAWLHGIANLRGEIVSVLNLSRICGKTSLQSNSSKSKLIVLKPQAEASCMAFPVDRLSEIVTLRKDDIQPVEDPRFTRKVVQENACVILLDIEKLLSSLI